MKRSLYCILAAFLLLTATAISQTTSVDVLYLKNGSIIRGQVTSLNTKSVKIQTSDGSLLCLPYEGGRQDRESHHGTVLRRRIRRRRMKRSPKRTVTQVEVPEAPPKPKKTGVHFGIRGVSS